MTEFEKWSLAFTAIGHLFVATSILYAARQWLISQKSFEREIIKDTRNYISSINDQIHMYQREIVKNDLNPWESSHGIDDCTDHKGQTLIPLPVRKSKGSEIEGVRNRRGQTRLIITS